MRTLLMALIVSAPCAYAVAGEPGAPASQPASQPATGPASKSDRIAVFQITRPFSKYQAAEPKANGETDAQWQARRATELKALQDALVGKSFEAQVGIEEVRPKGLGQSIVAMVYSVVTVGGPKPGMCITIEASVAEKDASLVTKGGQVVAKGVIGSIDVNDKQITSGNDKFNFRNLALKLQDVKLSPPPPSTIIRRPGPRPIPIGPVGPRPVGPILRPIGPIPRAVAPIIRPIAPAPANPDKPK